MAAAQPVPLVPPVRDDALALLRHVAIGAVAGAIAGFVVGGVLGRTAMFVLRVTTGDAITGVVSDDGFEMGRVTAGGTAQLLGGYTALGVALGLLYALVRRFLPPRGRIALWTLVTAAVGGGLFVHADGIDYLLLDPLWLAIAFFVLLPAAAGFTIAWLTERLEAGTGAPGRTWQFVAAGISAVVVFVVPLLVAGGALLLLGRSPVLRRVADGRAVRIAAVVVTAAIAVFAGADLVAEARVILSR